MRASKFLYFCAIALVFAALLTTEVEARRKILRGRKTITRTYYKSSILPAWAITVLVGVGQVVGGALLYLLMKKLILDPPLGGTYSPAAHVTS